MASVCEICGKSPMRGVKYTRRGAAKRKGGAGQKVTGKTKRMLMPNLQRVRTVTNGTPRRLFVCTSCLSAGKVVKKAR
jgi:large subunit ribosomal protein L28